ncbi:lipase 3 [Plutella xylostella]|uniref:lipase 3 n=1 Tax=Plutella xylostella TaxID=51655 RepID=UPI0020322854|nr:lipase 3 [Plutella xylostella]
MKNLTIVLFTLVIFCHYADCGYFSFLDKFTNSTAQITGFLRMKGRKLVHKIGNFILPDAVTKKPYTTPDRMEDAESRSMRKFSEYATEAQRKDSSVFDAIAPAGGVDCRDDVTVQMTTPELIALHGYTSESHTVITDDGYILTLHRIPVTSQREPRETVLLHHGLLGSSADWVIPGPRHALAYILSDAGYDVWLANVRGNTYSRAHISRKVDSFQFWNFTFHEVAQHDLPTVIDYIMRVKGGKTHLHYVGHSMGTTVLFALLSTKPRYNKILKAGYALAPVAYMSDIRSPIKMLARFSNNIEYLLKLLGANEFLPQNAVLRWLSKHMCEINHYEEAICENSMFVLCGHDESQFNRTLLPHILAHVPAGASTRTLVHYAQEIKAEGRFQQFDYGSEGNMRHYGTKSPPEYPLHNITLPIALLSAKNDWLAGDIDVARLFSKLANPIEHYEVPYDEFNHIDFLYAIDAPALVYDKLLRMLEDRINEDKAIEDRDMNEAFHVKRDGSVPDLLSNTIDYRP